jgi:peptidoglycan-N-acetylglucosamine deacetylase
MIRRHLLVFLLPLLSTAILVPAEVHLPPLAAPRYRVALTFDDGPKPNAVPLHELLDQYGVRATFFVVGEMAKKHPEMVRSLSRQGHEIASHTWSHRDVRRLPLTELKIELDMTRRLIKELTGRDQWLFRAPGGTDKFFRRRFIYPPAYTMVLWDLHSLDHEGRSAADIAYRLTHSIKDGDIVLLHSGVEATNEALGRVIPELRKRGFDFVTVSELTTL